MLVNVHKVVTVTTCAMIAFMWLFWVHCILLATNQAFSKLLAFRFFMILVAVWSVEISFAVLAVDDAYFARFKIRATAFTFLRKCSHTAGTIATIA